MNSKTLKVVQWPVLIQLILCVGIFTVGADLIAQDKTEKTRTLYVPFEDLNILFDGGSQHVYLSRKEYEELLARTKEKKVEKPPREFVYSSASHKMLIDGELARISTKLGVKTFGDQLHAVPIKFRDLSIQSAKLGDGSQAPLGKNKNGETVVFLAGDKNHSVDLEFVALMNLETAKQSVGLQLPPASLNELTISVDGNVELTAGAAVISRRYNQPTNRTVFELVPSRDLMNLVLSVNNKKLQEKKSILAKSVFIHELTSNYEQIHARVNVDILYGETDQVRFELPENFQVTEVTCPELANWRIESQAGTSILVVQLRESIQNSFALNIAAASTQLTPEKWVLKQLKPIGFSGTVSVVGLVAEERFELQSISAGGLIAIDNQQIQASIPETVFKTSAGAPAIATVAAFYAPDSEFSLEAVFVRPKAALETTPTSILFLSDRNQKLIGQYQIKAVHEKIINFDLDVPADWRVTSLKGADGKPLPFQRIRDAEKTHLNVKIPGGLPAGSATAIVFEAQKTSDQWNSKWESTEVQFPIFTIAGSRLDKGAIAVAVEDDLVVRPQSTRNLETLLKDQKNLFGLEGFNTSLTFEVIQQDFEATLAVNRLQSQVTATAYNFIQLLNKRISVHYEVSFDIQSARSRQLSFILPKSTPKEIQIKSLESVRISQTDSKELDEGRRWTIELAEPMLGEMRLAVDFVQNLESEEPQGFSLPLVKVENVGYQTTLVAFEGNPDFDIDLSTSMRSIDVGEMGDAQYIPGARLLGAFSAVGSDAELAIDVRRRKIHQLPTAIVESALLKTVVARNGKSQSVAEYVLLTKVPFVELQLPQNAELWAAQLDGTPTRPQLRKGSVLISLPPDSTQSKRTLSIFYEDTISTIGLSGNVDLTAPRLLIRGSEEAEAVEVPQAELRWQVTLPSGYTIASNQGSVYTSTEERRPLPFQSVTESLSRLIPSFGLPFAAREGRAVADKSSTMESAQSGSAGPALIFDGAEAEDEARMPGFGGGRYESPGRQSGAKLEESGTDDPFGDSVRNSAPASKDIKAKPAEKQPLSKSEKLSLWAKKGINGLTVSELSVEFGGETKTVELESLGQQAQISVTIIDQDRIHWLSFAYGGLIIALGLFLCRSTAKVKIYYLMLVILIAAIVPLLGDWTQSFWRGLENSLYACCFLLLAYLVHFVVTGLLGFMFKDIAKFLRWLLGLPEPRTTASLLIICLSVCANYADGQEKKSTESQSKPAEVEIPADAIIVPYDPSKPQVESDQIFIPYDRYLELLKKADPERAKSSVPLPADFGWSGAEYSATLEGSDLILKGLLEFECFVDSKISIPLPLNKAVVTRASLDGAPAKLKVVSAAELAIIQRTHDRNGVAKNGPGPNANAANRGKPKPQSQLVLLAEGKGRKKLELDLRIPITQVGGWRRVTAGLPACPAARINLRLPEAGAELNYRINGKSVKFISQQGAESASLPIRADGQIDFSWRGQVTSTKVDQNLTLNSTALFDVRNDGLHLVWNLDFLFRGNQRDKFEVELPKDFSVVRLYGQNVRGWEVREEAQANILDVTLLSEADSRENFTLELSNREMDLSAATSFPMPTVVVADAAIHSGQITVRKSDSLELQTDTMIGISRIDTSEAKQVRPKAEPLFNPTVFQAFEFSRTPFSVAIRCQPKPKGLEVKTRSLIDIREKSCGLDSQIICSSVRPVHELTIQLPQDLQIQTIQVPTAYRQATSQQGEHQQLKLFLGAGLQGNFRINISGRLRDHAETGQIPLPKILVSEATQQAGEISAVAENQLIVEPISLVDCKSVLLSTVKSWLNNLNQARVRVAIVHPTGEFAGNLKVTRKTPVVTATSISNLNVTLRSIEESVMVNFEIRDAGVDSVSFLIPKELKDARIKADLVREKKLEPIGEAVSATQYRLTLVLQDFVIGQYRVLLEQDRGLSGTRQIAPIPSFEQGVTETGRFVTLQNSGFDELLIKESVGLQDLDRRQKQFRSLKSLIGGADIRRAYLVEANQNAPVLAYQTNQRQLVETVGASIGLSEIEITIDRSGAYRAEQNFYVDNRTEPFLEIRLPDNSRLWTVKVANAPVKPIAIEDDKQAVRIPLIKTADGDTDFLVAIKYGGSVGKLANLSKLEFPFTKTTNIDVASTNVRLNLPEDFDFWWFKGTLGVSEEEQIAQAKNAYETALFSKLQSQAKNSKSELVRQRAAQNLTLLNESAQALPDEISQSAQGKAQVDNRETFNQLFRDQRLELFGNSGNVSNTYGGNFGAARDQGQNPSQSSFNSKWLDSNDLVNPKVLEQNKRNTRFNAPAFLDESKSRSGKQDLPIIEGGGAALPSKEVQLQQEAQMNFQKQIGDNLDHLQEQSQKARRGGNKKDAILRKYRSQLNNRNVNRGLAYNQPQQNPGGFGPGGAQSGNAQSSNAMPRDANNGQRPAATAAANDGDFATEGFVSRSLDIQFEHRGKTFLFQTPSGDLQLKVTVVSKSLQRRSVNFLVLFGVVCVMGCCLWFFGSSKRQAVEA